MGKRKSKRKLKEKGIDNKKMKKKRGRRNGEEEEEKEEKSEENREEEKVRKEKKTRRKGEEKEREESSFIDLAFCRDSSVVWRMNNKTKTENRRESHSYRTASNN